MCWFLQSAFLFFCFFFFSCTEALASSAAAFCKCTLCGPVSVLSRCLNTFLQRKPGAALEVQMVCLAPELSPWENQIQNATQATNYCTVLDKATCTFRLCHTPERKGCKPEEKRIMRYSLSIERVLKGPLTKRRWKLGVSWPVLAFSFVTMLTFFSISSTLLV